jgi:cell wall-associated NlpC family hydrolase
MKRYLLAVSFPALLVVVLFVTAIIALTAGGSRAASCTTSGSVVVSPSTVTIDPTGIYIGGSPMSSVQIQDAETIIGVAEARALSARDTLIVLMIGLEETKLTNPDSGTGDSLGIFQQSPANGWGTPEQIMNVVYAVNALIDHLLEVSDRDSMSLLGVALAIQHPNPAAYQSPANYFQGWEMTAERILAAANPPVSGTADQIPSYQQVCAVTGLPDGRVETAVQFALSVIGTPYVWGGESETGGFDCSGLVWWAFSQAGFPVTRTSAAGEYSWGTPVDLGQLQRGDLVFWAYDPADPVTIHHVAIYIGGGQIVAAPHTGDVVKVEPLYDIPHMLAARVQQTPGGK